MTKIGTGAFCDCKGLASITIPESVIEISDWAFSGCTGLSSVTILGNNFSVHRRAFPDNKSLRLYVNSLSLLPSNLRPYATLGFAEHNRVSTPFRDEYLKYIKTNAAKLMELAIGNEALLDLMCHEKLISITNAPRYMEAAQKSGNVQAIAMLLEYVHPKAEKEPVKKKKIDKKTIVERKSVRQNKTGIGGMSFVVAGTLKTFENRAQLKELIVSNGGKMVSAMSSKVDYLIMNDVSADAEKQKQATALDIKIISEVQFNRLIGRQFKITPNHILEYCCYTDEDVSIPEGVTKIGNLAFRDCTGVTHITIPNGVTIIGGWAFSGCTELTGITIPESVTEIGYGAFRGCTGLSSITIPENVTIIGYEAFSGCTGLTGIIIPEGVTQIENGTFQNCTNLTSITIPESVTEICYEAFSGCTKLTSIIVPKSVSEIVGWAFSGCTGLASIALPKRVTEIGIDAFKDCTKLTIHAPAGSYAETYAKENNIPFVAE